MKAKEQRSWTVEKVVGHLVEIRVNRLDSIEEVKRFSEAIQRTAASTPDAVLIVDLRTPVVFPQPVTSAVVELMTKANKVRKKTAILLAGELDLLRL
jgi:anti-anti-sigma regulatory factor